MTAPERERRTMLWIALYALVALSGLCGAIAGCATIEAVRNVDK